MPDEDDFEIHDPEHVFEKHLTTSGIDVPDGDSGVLTKQPVDPGLLQSTCDGNILTIQFHAIEVPDELCIAGYRDQVFQLLQQHPDCTVIRFDLTGIRLVPSGLLGLLASVQQRGYSVEIVNPSGDVQAVLRTTKLDSLLKIHVSQP